MTASIYVNLRQNLVTVCFQRTKEFYGIEEEEELQYSLTEFLCFAFNCYS